MAKITVYQPLQDKGPDGKWYKAWEVEEGTPLGDVVYEAPSKTLAFPRYDREKGIWIEDKDSIIESFKSQIEELQSFVTGLYEGGKPNE